MCGRCSGLGVTAIADDGRANDQGGFISGFRLSNGSVDLCPVIAILVGYTKDVPFEYFSKTEYEVIILEYPFLGSSEIYTKDFLLSLKRYATSVSEFLDGVP